MMYTFEGEIIIRENFEHIFLQSTKSSESNKAANEFMQKLKPPSKQLNK